MFRGFEKILQGRDPHSGLLVTPRVCGICGGSHLYCASSALDTIWKTTLPPNALLLRAIGQASESLQSDPRWFYAIFATDLSNKKFSNKLLYDEVVRSGLIRWHIISNWVGSKQQARQSTSLFGGQWPHSSYMVPGGVMSAPTLKDITRAYAILNRFKNEWLEPVWLGCSINRYMQIQSWDELMVWLEEKMKAIEIVTSVYFFALEKNLVWIDSDKASENILRSGLFCIRINIIIRQLKDAMMR